MTFLFPGYLVAAGGLGLGVILLHLIVTREPNLLRLPTARFAPDRPVQARARALVPSDLLLLAVRVALLLAIGAGLARPQLHLPSRRVATIVVLDRSRAVASAGEAIDSARGLLGPRDVLVVFDSTTETIRKSLVDSLAALRIQARKGSLSAALIAALRAASAMRNEVDSLGLALVSPLAAEEFDAATDSIRALWPGTIRLVHLSARAISAPRSALSFRGRPDDPLRAALADSTEAGDLASVRIVRGVPVTADSTWAMEPDRVLVLWPEVGVPPGWLDRVPSDTVGAVVAGDAVVVAPFERRGTLPSTSGPSRILARWADGSPSADEVPSGAGCIRRVAIPVPARGDLVLTPRFARLAVALSGPCGGEAALASAGADAVARLAGAGSGSRVLAATLPVPDYLPSPLAKWLLLAAVGLAAVEHLLRRRNP